MNCKILTKKTPSQFEFNQRSADADRYKSPQSHLYSELSYGANGFYIEQYPNFKDQGKNMEKSQNQNLKSPAKNDVRTLKILSAANPSIKSRKNIGFT